MTFICFFYCELDAVCVQNPQCANASECIREKVHNFPDARIRENLNRTIVYFLYKIIWFYQLG